MITLFTVPKSDKYVKEAIAELTRILDESLNTIEYDDTTVFISESELDKAFEIIYDTIFDEALSRTHRRSRAAKEVDDQLRSKTGDVEFGSPQTYYPNKRSDKGYEDSRISPQSITKRTVLDKEDLEILDSEYSIYRLRESYIGNTGLKEFQGALDRAEEAYDIFTNGIKDSIEQENCCICCGRTDLPTDGINEVLEETRRYEDKEKLEDTVESGTQSNPAFRVEYGQSMTPYLTKGGKTSPSGVSNGDSYITGRCPVCVFAGFYYTLMPKVTDVVSYKDSLFRILTPTGSFSNLVDVRRILSSKLMPLVDKDKVRTQTLELIRTESDNARYLHLLEMLREGFEKPTSPTESELLPLGITSTITTTDKGPFGQRGFQAFDSIDSHNRLIEIVKPFETRNGKLVDNPISELVCKFINIKNTSGDNEVAVEFKDLFCEGIIKKDLHKVERGSHNIYKAYHSDSSLSGKLFSSWKLSLYMNSIMSDNMFSNEQLESIRNVGSAIGQEFHKEMSVMISLQNAGSKNQFLEAFEKAGMQAYKKGSSNASENNYTPTSDDINTVVELLMNDETFEETKHLVVIHASFAGHYENLQDQRGDNNE